MEVLFAGVRVRSIEAATDWWTRLFGREPDMVPYEDEAMWRVAGAGWLFVRRDPSRAGDSLVTICVDDLQVTTAELAERSIDFGPIAAVSDEARKAIGQDPDGNTVELIEVSSREG